MDDGTTLTARELAERLAGELIGDASATVRTVATLEEAGEGALSWVGSERLASRLADTRAEIVIIPEKCDVPAGQTAIRVADPDLAVCEVLAWLAPPLERVPVGVHASAVVAADAVVEGAAIGPHTYIGARAVIAPGAEIHAGVYIGSDARVGRDCVLWPNVVLRERCTLGQRVIVHPNSTIGSDGFSYLQRGGTNRKIPQIGTVVVEDDVEIGANSAIDRARSGATRIGSGTKIDNNVQVGHNVQIASDCIIIANTAIGGSAVLGRNVMLSGCIGIRDHVKLGDGVQIAGGSSVMKDMPAGTLQRGSPAIEHASFLRQNAALRKLPKWIEEVRALRRRLADLEQAVAADR